MYKHTVLLRPDLHRSSGSPVFHNAYKPVSTSIYLWHMIMGFLGERITVTICMSLLQAGYGWVWVPMCKKSLYALWTSEIIALLWTLDADMPVLHQSWLGIPGDGTLSHRLQQPASCAGSGGLKLFIFLSQRRWGLYTQYLCNRNHYNNPQALIVFPSPSLDHLPSDLIHLCHLSIFFSHANIASPCFLPISWIIC